MYSAQKVEKLPNLSENRVEEEFHPDLLAKWRHEKFIQFLRHEWKFCRTQAEREVVLSAFVTADLRMKRLANRLNRI
jgi:hypothetical protein